MNIFKELKKAPKVDINDVSYGRGGQLSRLKADSEREELRNKALARWSNPKWVAERSNLGRIMPEEEKKKKSRSRQKWLDNPVNHEKMKQIRNNNAQSRLAKQKRKQIEKYYTLWRAEVDQKVRTCKRMYSAQKISILLGIEKGCVNHWLTKIHKETIV